MPVRDDKLGSEKPSPGGQPAAAAAGAIHGDDRDVLLREAEARFGGFMANLPGLAWIKDADGCYVFANAAAAAAFDIPLETLYGKTDYELFPPETVAQFRENDQRALNGTGTRSVETLMHRDGVLHYSIVTKFPIVMPDGEIVIGGMAIDITEQKRAENDLRAKDAELQLIANTTPMILTRCDRDARYRFINQAGATVLGRERNDIIGRPMDEVLGPEAFALLQPYIREVLNGNRTEFEVQIPLPTVGLRQMRVTYIPEIDDHGEVSGWIASVMDITDRKAIEQDLRRSQQRFQLAQKVGNVGIWDWNISDGTTYWSETTWEFYGETPDGQNPDDQFWTDHLHPDDRDRVRQNLDKTVNSRADRYRDEFRILRKDRSVLWIESNARVSRDAGGLAIRMYGVNIDITSRRQTEDRIRENEKQLRLVTDAMPALISYVDRDERFRFANQTYRDWFGIAPENVAGKKVKDIFGSRAYRILKPSMDNALGGRECSFEAEVNYKNGETRFVHISYVPDFDADGSVRGYFGLTTDMTDLKRSQELLTSTEEKIALIMDTFTDYAIFSLDRKGVIDSWNAGAREIYGYSEHEMLGRTADILFTPEDVAQGLPLKEMRTARLKGRASDERWHVKKDGTRFFASGIMMPLYLGRTLTGYAKIAGDLTVRKRHAEEMQRAHDELEKRVFERTQELADTNAALISEAEGRISAEEQRNNLLRRLVTNQELERRRIARDIHDQLGQQLTALRLKIESLRLFVKADDVIADRVVGLQEISERLDSEVSFLAWELRPTVLDDLGLAEALYSFVNEWSRHFDVNANFQKVGVGKERFDPEMETHLYRITQEALNNITKHARAKNVMVMLEKRKDDVVLIIEDDGCGFDPVSMDVPRASGRGLGLRGMRERASLAGGELEIESSDTGTTIFVRIPAPYSESIAAASSLAGH